MQLRKETQTIIQYLTEINKIPRASGDERALSEFLMKFAADRGVESWLDEKGNFYAKLPKNGECSDEPVIIQGHLDMVYVRTDECPHAYEDGIVMLEDKNWLYADGTSLGADNGIAVVYCMELMDKKDLEHPPIELILTVEEEIGLIGAKHSDLSKFEGKKLINLDSEEEGTFCISCAGGCRSTMFWNAKKEALPQADEYQELTVRIFGLKGGHSGANIDLGRANAIQLSGRILHHLNRRYDYYLSEIHAPGKENIISREVNFSVYAKTEDAAQMVQDIKEFESIFKNEYDVVDTVNVSVEVKEGKADVQVYPQEVNARLAGAFVLMPQGVLTHSKRIENLVETSMNMGSVEEEDGGIRLIASLRSSVSSQKHFLRDKIEVIGSQYSDEVQFLNEYPEWEYKEESELRDVACEAFKTLFAREAKVEAIHAGLECGYFYEQDPSLDIISFGPTVLDVHSVEEKVEKSSIGRTWWLLKEILRSL